MTSHKKAANAVGGKTARACDSCMCKRARWYCTADDAFLCQACDASVHSANSLARRHERVLLKTSSMKLTEKPNNSSINEIDSSSSSSLPTWHQGFRRKPRTPRHGKPTSSPKTKAGEPILMSKPLLPLVPEIGNDETSPDENEEQLLYRVPIFDPFVSEFCTSIMPNEATDIITSKSDDHQEISTNKTSKNLLPEYGQIEGEEFENFSGFNLPSDMDLTEFAADVETLLGKGLNEDSFGMEGLGLLESKEEDYCCFGSTNSGRVKEEEDDEELEAVVTCHMDQELDMYRETLDLNFDYDSPTTGEEEDEKVVNTIPPRMMIMNEERTNKTAKMSKNISLRLNHEAVIAAWASHGLPWTTGVRPPVNPDDCWPDCLVPCPTDRIHHHGYGDVGGLGNGGGHIANGGDGGREARVSRYREKRRTRLFSKKIRYEVRKLNAEKRPRMKGRFVKRTSLSSFMGNSTTTSTTTLPF